MKDSELRQRLDIEITVLETWVAQGWIIPAQSLEGIEFTDADVARGQLILDLSRSMGVNEAGVDVAMALLDQVHGLRSTLRALLEALDRQQGLSRNSLLPDVVDID